MIRNYARIARLHAPSLALGFPLDLQPQSHPSSTPIFALNPYEMSIIPKGTWIVVTGGPHCGWRGCVEGVVGTGPDLAYRILFKHVDQDWVTLAIPARWVVG